MKLFAKAPRKALIFVLLYALCLMSAPHGQAVSVSDFTDVPRTAWYYDAVAYVTSNGLFNGVTDDTFAPNSSMTRGMFITVLGRYAHVQPAAWLQATVSASGTALRLGAGESYAVQATLRRGAIVTLQGQHGDWYKVKSGSLTGYVAKSAVAPRYHSFSDVNCGSYFAGYAIWAYENHIVNGMGSSSIFSPNTNVTREQLCSLLNRYAAAAKLQLTNSKPAVTFTDAGSISSWAKTDVTAMQRSGVVEGNAKGAFLPKNAATRAEAAAMFQRFAGAASGSAAKPTATPAPTASPKPTTSPNPTAQPKPSNQPLPEDSPATLITGSVSLPATVIRVGVLVKTARLDSSVQAVTLENLQGEGFAFGAMDADRRFVSSGKTTADAIIRIVSDGVGFRVTDSAGKLVYSGGGELAIQPAGRRALTRVNGEYRYFGDFTLRQASGKSGYITLINYVNIEDYVKGVLPYELSVAWPSETLKAGAVASRTHIMSMVDSAAYRAYGMDVAAEDGTQLYRGRGISYSESTFTTTDAAAAATAGMYLTYSGTLCVTSYSACDGGRIKSAKEVFGVDYPYLVEKDDPYEKAAVGDIIAAGGTYDDLVRASHRVGLSQWGAYAMGRYYGKDYQTILGFYFPGTHLQYGDA